MIAIPPCWDSMTPYIVISSEVETNVTLQQELDSWEIYVPGDGATRYTLSNSDRVVDGLETKAFEITADVPISVYLGTDQHASLRTPDDILMKPIDDADTEFIITSFAGESTGDSRPMSFFMIIPREHGTIVNILKFENDMWVEQYSGVVQKFEVLTHDAYYSGDRKEDFTGWRVNASQPIAVISGHGRTRLGGSDLQYVCDSLPSRAALVTEYVTFPIVLGIDATFYRLRIVSAEDDVTVTVPDLGIIQRITEGGFIEIDSDSLTSMIKVGLIYLLQGLNLDHNTRYALLV